MHSMPLLQATHRTACSCGFTFSLCLSHCPGVCHHICLMPTLACLYSVSQKIYPRGLKNFFSSQKILFPWPQDKPRWQQLAISQCYRPACCLCRQVHTCVNMQASPFVCKNGMVCRVCKSIILMLLWRHQMAVFISLVWQMFWWNSVHVVQLRL